EVLPIGGINAKIEAAYESGINKIIVPAMNKDDIILDKKISKKIKIYYVKDFIEVLKIALKDCEQKKKLISKIKKIS
ncbi:MAG: S16 family serine protease, partial [archaeon]